MTIGIHKSNWGFSNHWIDYCKEKNIPYQIVDCYSSEIINQLADCDILMWHHHHSNAKDVLFAKGLLYALEQAGKKVFPEFNSSWHFDDKVGQKYLLEAIGAPMAKTWVFYEGKSALDWIGKTSFPKVFKLRCGAGSTNVKLVKSKKDAERLVKKAFGKGFSPYDGWNDLREQYLRFTQGSLTVLELAKSFRRLVFSTKFSKTIGNERGYIYFQDFVPDNDSDIRVIVIGDKAFAIKRMNRPNDFRASGGGEIKYEKNLIDERCVKISFETSDKLNASCVAYDFVFDDDDQPLIIEINYGFAHQGYYKCRGYWDRKIKWHEGEIKPLQWMIDNLIGSRC